MSTLSSSTAGESSDYSRRVKLIALALALAVLVVEARIVVGGKTWDDLRYHTEIAPPRLAAAAAVQAGELPAWWDGTGFGVPLVGEPTHGAAYPPGWLAATPGALDLVFVLHALWAALGVAVWARRRGASNVGALVAGVLVAGSGIVATAAVRGTLPALAHLPWIGWAATRLADADKCRGRAAAVLAALVGAIALAGSFALLVDGIALAAVLGGRRRTAGWLALAIGAGLAIGAVQWLPAVTVGAPRDAWSLVELIVPSRFGLYVGPLLIALAAVHRPDGRTAAVMIGLAAAAMIFGPVHVMALAVVVAAHAGRGAAALAAGHRSAVVGVAAAAVLAGVAFAIRPELGVGLGVATIAAAALVGWRWPGRFAPVVVLLIVTPSFAIGITVAPVVDRAILDEPAWAVAATGVAEPRRMFRPKIMFDGPVTLDDELATLAGASAARFGIAAARSDDPARPALHDRVWLAAAHDGGALLERYGVALAILPTSVSQQGFDQLARRGMWSLVRYNTMPAAAVFASWEWGRVDALVRLFPPAGRLDRRMIVLAGDGTPSQELADVRPCAIERWTAGAIELACTAEVDGYAVVTSTPASGWTASVDGVDAPWVTADVLRRAVAVPAGGHRVTWRYAAPRLGWGIGLAGLGVLATLAMANPLKRKRYRASPATT